MISLIHPSRGRPQKSAQNAYNWLKKAGTDDIELIVVNDLNDTTEREYRVQYHGLSQGLIPFARIVDNHESVVHATNMGVAKSRGDILIYLSDDFDCPDNWGQLIINEFSKYSGPTLIKVDDCLQSFHVDVLTIPMMNRELYDKLGYFWHPGYRSMFCDVHLYWRTRKLGALQYAPHLKFEHKHVSVGKSDDDETYRRSAANWNQGKELFAKHKAAGFIV